MLYRITWKPSAERAFRKLPRQTQGRIRPRVDALASNPRPDGVRNLEGDDNAWRIRVGEFRIVFEIHDAVLIVMIVRIAIRRDAYR